MVRLVRTKTRRAIANAARRGAKTVKTVAGDALGAAAKAATGVVLDSTTKMLEAGRTKVARSAPSIQRAAGKAARRTVSGRGRKKSARKRRTSAAKRKVKHRAR